MDPITELMNEHRIIETALDAMEVADQKELPFDFYARAVDFIANFADGCHHAKEEDELFPLMEEKGILRQGGPIGVMCEEHEIGRGLVALMREGIEKQDRDTVRRAARDYCALLRQHIRKEDNILFPMGRSCISDLEMDNLRSHFDQVDHAETCHHKYEKLGQELLAEANA